MTETGANYAVEFTAVSILKCAIGDPSSEWATFDGVAVNTALSNGDLTATHSNSSVGGARTASIKTAGKYYYEMTVNNLGVDVSLGYASNSGLEFLRSAASYTTGGVYVNETILVIGHAGTPGAIIDSGSIVSGSIGSITGLTTI